MTKILTTIWHDFDLDFVGAHQQNQASGSRHYDIMSIHDTPLSFGVLDCVDTSVDAAVGMRRRAGDGAKGGVADGRGESNRISPPTVALVPCGHVRGREDCASKHQVCTCYDTKVAATIRIFLG